VHRDGGGREGSTPRHDEHETGRMVELTRERRALAAPRWLVHTVGGRWLRVRTFRAGTDAVVGDPTARVVLDVGTTRADADPVWVSMTAAEARELAAELFARSEELDPSGVPPVGHRVDVRAKRSG
jgi:hypothetical protein